MIVNIDKLKEAIEQALREVNDACFQMRSEGVVVLLPDSIDFEVNMVTDNDINAVSRTTTETEADGSTVTLREQLASDTERVESSGEDYLTTRTPSAGSEQTVINHPSVQTQGSGADNADETVIYTYEEA